MRSDDVSIYKGIAPDVQAKAPWTTILKAIQSGQYRKQIEALRKIQDPEIYRQKKTGLTSVTFGGTFNGRRNNASILTPTGFIVADIDHIDDAGPLIDSLAEDEHVWFAFVSPGSDGVKAAFRSKSVSTDTEHKQLYAAVSRYVKDVYKIDIDPACKDISRLTFVSWDPFAHINPQAIFFDHSTFEEDETKPQPAVPPISKPTTAKLKYGIAVLESACKKIAESQPGNQHHTRVEQATLVGGFIASAYIDHKTALDFLARAVADSGAQQITKAMKDITDGIAYGVARPLNPIDEKPKRKQSGAQGPPDGPAGPEPTPYPEQRLEQEREKQEEQFLDRIKGIDAAMLMGLQFPEPVWVVDELIPEGVIIFAGKPKAGKSVLALNLCVAIAKGGRFFGKDIEQGNVLYLHLEDNQRRIQNRISYMTLAEEYAGQDATDGLQHLHLYYEWPRMGEGGLRSLDLFLTETPCRLVAIDTFKMFQPMLSRRDEKKNQYEIDYDRLSSLRYICEKHHTTVMPIMHARKQASEDPIDMISGTLGLSGAVDNVMVLHNRRGLRANLYFQGREVDTLEYTIGYFKDSWTWQMIGKASEVFFTESQQEVLQCVRECTKPVTAMTPTEIAASTGIKKGYIQQKILPKLLKEGFILRYGRGKYYYDVNYANGLS